MAESVFLFPTFGPIALLILMVMSIMSIGLVIWALVDISKRNAVDVYAAGYNKTAWVVVIVVMLFMSLGWIPSIFYLIGPWRKIGRAEMSRRELGF